MKYQLGDDVVYLDPHTTQEISSVGSKQTDSQKKADLTYHCTNTPRMPFNRLDPSMTMVCILIICRE